MCVTIPAAGHNTRDQQEVLRLVLSTRDELLVCLAYESPAVPVKLLKSNLQSGHKRVIACLPSTCPSHSQAETRAGSQTYLRHTQPHLKTSAWSPGEHIPAPSTLQLKALHLVSLLGRTRDLSAVECAGFAAHQIEAC